MKKLITKIVLLAITLFPIVTFAQFNTFAQFPTVGQVRTLSDLVILVVGYFNVGIYLIMGLAVVMFVWNIFKYFIKGGDKVDRAEAGKYVMWSIIGFFVILSFWGLVNILTYTFKLNSTPPNQFFGNFGSSQGTGGTGVNQGGITNPGVNQGGIRSQ